MLSHAFKKTWKFQTISYRTAKFHSRHERVAKDAEWYWNNRPSLLEQYNDQWIACCENSVVVVCSEYDEFQKKIVEFSDKNPNAFLYLVHVGREKDDYITPIIVPILAITGDLDPAKIIHKREGEFSAKFQDEGRFVSPYPKALPNLHRPVVSTLVSSHHRTARITSFVLDTGSPFTFVTRKVVSELLAQEFALDVYGYVVYKDCSIRGKDMLLRESCAHFPNVNILGTDFIYRCSSLHLSYTNQSILLKDE
eukprot:TRINITY_DN1658_c0_g1_i1.p1 TRINITY_DN1658_c0_g1~~TRINITY_DN1658_c0_g1_i1.p1  ORF type:complete len:252 (+),score=6.75 TRINITY_DN1658_c0_g1_i1:41-796(+)